MGILIFLGVILIGLAFLGFCLYIFTEHFDKEYFEFSLILFVIGSFLLVLSLIFFHKTNKKYHIIITTSNGVVEEYEDCNYEIDRYRITVTTSEGEIIYYYSPSKIEEVYK